MIQPCEADPPGQGLGAERDGGLLRNGPPFYSPVPRPPSAPASPVGPPNMLGILLRPFLLLAAVALAACASTSHPYHFEPSPAEVQIETAPGGTPLARVLVGVMGAERLGKARSGHPDLLLRVRVESKGPGPVRFDPASAVVLGPDLASFGPARVDGPDAQGVIEVPQGGARDVTLRCAFPRDGDLRMARLTGINVRLTIDTPAGSKELSIALARSQSDYWYGSPYYGYPYGYPYPYYPGGYPYWHWNVGFAYSSDC